MEYILSDKTLLIKIESLFNDTIQSFFDEYIPSKKIQHLLIQNKWIKIDGNNCKREDYLAGINLEINIYPTVFSYTKIDKKVDVVYEDELICVVNKPKEVLVHDDGNNEETLSDFLKSYYYESPYISVYPIHRLDYETSGLVVFSKSIIFQPLLDKLMSEKQIRRYYLAFVKGKLEKGEKMVIDEPIGKDRHDSRKKVVYKSGLFALTKVKSLGYIKKYDLSILRCTLDTGRTHQIRVHLQSKGLPIINDPLYGQESGLAERMGLVSDELEFFHPLKEEMVKVSIDLPNDLSKLYMEVTK